MLLAVCGLLAGCGGHEAPTGSTLQSALVGKNVEGLFTTGLVGVQGPVCTPSTLAGNFNCTATPIYAACTPETVGPCASRLAPAEVWIDCFSQPKETDQWSCQLADPPAGTSVFTTAAQRAAPKHAIWQCANVNVAQQKIGPFLIATNDPHGPTQQVGSSITQEQAQALAAKKHLKLAVDC